MYQSSRVKEASLLVVLLCCYRTGAIPQNAESLRECGNARYFPSKYTCYEGDFLCPIIDGQPTLKCNQDCYLPSMYSCEGNHLVYPPISSVTTSSSVPTSTISSPSPSCTREPTRLQLSDPPYENFFYSDCDSASQVVVTSPLEDSNLTIIGPRLLVAWASGNSGVCAFFEPQNGVNGSLGIRLENSSSQQYLEPIYREETSSKPFVGVTGYLDFNSSARLTVPLLGSIRTIRDFTEGPSLQIPQIQDAIEFSEISSGGASLTRLWLDNITTTELSFAPVGEGAITINNRIVEFEAGTYQFNASFNYPQLEQISTQGVLGQFGQNLIAEFPDQTESLSFLSYTTKLLAGAWRFLTYFGRDTMISMLLLQPVLSEGENGSIEAVIGAVLERINRTDGSVCHEETIGDYGTYLNFQKNITSTDPQYDYKMIDTDFFLPVAMESYFVKSPTGAARAAVFLETRATVDPANGGLSYRELATINAQKILNATAAFVESQTKENLIRLKENEVVGQWRDSTYGLGGGRIPYDVNTALVPAALRSLAALAKAGVFPDHSEWEETANQYADVWEDTTLSFFEVFVPQEEAKNLVNSFVSDNNLPIPAETESITSDVVYHAVALDGNNDQSVVKVMNTDDCFRLFMVNSTNQMQLTAFLNQAADNIIRPFPAGLRSNVGLFVANPAYGGDPVYAANFTNSAYHGSVVWSWQLAMMAAGLQRQLERCSGDGSPDFCGDSLVYSKVKQAYNELWDVLDANANILSSEVWSWTYRDGGYQVTPLGSLPPPPGVNPTESNVVQLWSLTFLAVRRDENLR